MKKNDLQAESAGFAPGIPGHYLSFKPPTHVGTMSKEFACTCGFGFHTNLRQDLKANSRDRTRWVNHLAGVTAPEEFIALGVVKLTRVTHEYVVFPSTYADAVKYHPSNGYWTVDRARQDGTWLVGIRKSNGHYTLEISQPTRKAAIAKALFILNREKNKGRDVTFYDESHSDDIDRPGFAPQATFALLLDEADACMAGDDLAKYLEVQQHLDDALALVPMLEAKRTQFLTRRVEVFGR